MIEKIISWFKSSDNPSNPNIRFGRYSDSFKSDKQVEYWNKALLSFEEKEYMQSYRHFFKYILDEKEKNVQYVEKGSEISFELYQGSKVVKGFVNDKQILAEVILARYESLNVALMRKLLEINYSLRYGRYALSDNSICLKFDTGTIDGSPEKLYYAFKEIATRADKQDDLLLHEFSALTPVDNSHIEILEEKEKEIKFEYMQKWINRTLRAVSQLDRQRFENTISYMLLNLAYKIDYLLTPQGLLMEELEQIHHTFFTNFGSSKAERNNKMIQRFENINRWKKDRIFEELYKVKSTFGVALPTSHRALGQMMTEELKNIQWYHKNNNSRLALDHLEYIAQYALFNYGLRMPTRLLLGMIIELLNADFLKELGFNDLLVNIETDKLNTSLIQKKLKEIQSNASKKFPHFEIEINKIKFDSKTNFVESMLKQIITLKYDLIV